MKLAEFAEHEVTLRGGWTDYHGQRRFLGALASAVPIHVMSLVASGGGFAYAKSGRTDGAPIACDLLIHPIWQGARFQIVLRTGNVLNTRAEFAPTRRIEIADRRDFTTGTIVDWAEPDAFGPTIRLLVLAHGDVELRRNGIWRVKAHHAAALPEPWRAALTKTRHGYIAP
jgi:hypothetical protein